MAVYNTRHGDSLAWINGCHGRVNAGLESPPPGHYQVIRVKVIRVNVIAMYTGGNLYTQHPSYTTPTWSGQVLLNAAEHFKAVSINGIIQETDRSGTMVLRPADASCLLAAAFSAAAAASAVSAAVSATSAASAATAAAAPGSSAGGPKADGPAVPEPLPVWS